MLDANADRLDYGALLEAPAGYTLDFALGTTYSLDLEALLGAYLSLGLAVAPDSALKDNPMRLFAALAEVQGKVLILCEKGRVKAPATYRALYSQVEDGIVQVDLEGDDYPSFHPKVWALRFLPATGRGQAFYRVCMLSRNLTFDSSWDVAGTMSGRVSGKARRADGGWYIEEALRRLAELCKGQVDAAYEKKLETMVEEIGHVNFRSDDEGWQIAYPALFSTPWTHSTASVKDVAMDLLDKASRATIMTPFVAQTEGPQNPLSRMAARIEDGSLAAEGSHVVIRRDSLLGLRGNWIGALPLYAIRRDLVAMDTEEDNAADDAASTTAKDIHAKVYLFEEATGGATRTHLLFGSANATRRGMEVNWESLLHLTSDDEHTYDDIVRELGLDEDSLRKGSLFDVLTTSEAETLSEGERPDKTTEREFDHFLRRIGAKMDVREGEGGLYTTTIAFDANNTNAELLRTSTIQLLSGGQALPGANKVAFESVAIDALSEFVKIRCTIENAVLTGVVKCELTTRAAEAMRKRRAALFQKICASDERSVLEYLAFRLSSNPELDASIAARLAQGTGMAGLSLAAEGLYESIVKSYWSRPADARRIVKECIRDLKDGAKANAEVAGAIELLRGFERGDKDARF